MTTTSMSTITMSNKGSSRLHPALAGPDVQQPLRGRSRLDSPRWEVGHLSEETSQRDGLAALVDVLSLSREQIMAHDHIRSWPSSSPDGLDAAYRQHGELSRWLTRHTPTDMAKQQAKYRKRGPRSPGCRPGASGQRR